jgi:hypothetical protein
MSSRVEFRELIYEHVEVRALSGGKQVSILPDAVSAKAFPAAAKRDTMPTSQN